jgi:cobalt-zinc-cadmium efflux system membrane fusion protein
MSDEQLDRRAWSHRRQWRAVAIAAAVLLAAVLLIWTAGRFSGTHQPEAAPSSPPGTFRASPQQLKTLTIEPVQTHAFATEERTEGKISVDADRATPVVSPYSGRVLRVIAGLGDSVKAGAALATLEASEFVQAQNDLQQYLQAGGAPVFTIACLRVSLIRTNLT